jgi:hypothetical protein
VKLLCVSKRLGCLIESRLEVVPYSGCFQDSLLAGKKQRLEGSPTLSQARSLSIVRVLKCSGVEYRDYLTSDKPVPDIDRHRLKDSSLWSPYGRFVPGANVSTQLDRVFNRLNPDNRSRVVAQSVRILTGPKEQIRRNYEARDCGKNEGNNDKLASTSGAAHASSAGASYYGFPVLARTVRLTHGERICNIVVRVVW